MQGIRKVRILLKDSDESEVHNIQIMEYLNERHRPINDAGYAITIDIVDDTNINKFIKQGVTSIPAIILPNDDDPMYGVNNIIATLAKLEIMQNNQVQSDRFGGNYQDDPDESFRETILKEMMSGEQEDENKTSSIRAKGQDIADRPPDEKDIDAKMAKYDSYYSGRGKAPGGKKSKGPPTPVKIPSAKQNIEKLIADKGYDKGEAAFMREVARNLE